MASDTALALSPAPSAVRSNIPAAPFVATIFASAALVFLVQPMFARLTTPLLGGSPAVWNVSLVCFQAALLVGYAYAHWLAGRRTLRIQVAIHTGVMSLAILTLPFGLSGLLGEPDPHRPVVWLTTAFVVSVAPVFVSLSATAPLVQAWYGRSGRADAHDPYFLYAASNAGSLLGLIAYPLVFEPFMPLATQGFLWSAAFVTVAAGLILSGGMVAFRLTPATSFATAEIATSDDTKPQDGPTWSQRARWLVLAFVPSSLLVGTTTHISTDIAAAPFLWSPPLILFIGSFIVVFSSARDRAIAIAEKTLPAAIALVLLSLVSRNWPIPAQLGADLFALAVAALYCHGKLAEERPAAVHLTEFYFVMSLGGVIGGAFNALLAPVLFDNVTEFPLMLVAVLFLLPRSTSGIDRKALALGAAAVVAVVTALVLQSAGTTSALSRLSLSILTVPVIAIALGRRRRAAQIVAAGAAATAGLTVPFVQSDTLHTERSFFGTMRVSQNDELRIIAHGTTLHGAQRVDHDGEEPQPLFYYHQDTPIGQAFEVLGPVAEEVGIIGLGSGAVACYTTSASRVVFWEIDPAIIRVARDPALFSYLSECGDNVVTVAGDGRLKLSAEAPGTFDLLLLDAFSSDAIPAHLLTQEALVTFMEKLTAEGVMAIHISNRHLDLAPIIARVAEAEGWAAQFQRYTAPENDPEFRTSTSVIMLARNREHFGSLATDERWSPINSDGGRVWTDDYTNILGAMLLKARAH